jgi:hypothetical protein
MNNTQPFSNDKYDKYDKERSSTSGNRSLRAFTESERDMQKIEEKKRDVEALKGKYNENIDRFIVFLLRCIKEVSKAHITNQEDVQQMVSRLEKELEIERHRVVELTSTISKNNKSS